MNSSRVFPLIPIGLIGLAGCGFSEQPVSFNSEIRPLLNDRCVPCHGGVKRASNLSLLFRSEALQAGESGRNAIVPGDSGDSELMRRITHSDPEQRMPRDREPLTNDEVALFRDWIDQGAEWETHWAYEKLVRPPVPEASDSSWPRNDIDRFILARLKMEGLEPSSEADRVRLIRRVSLDLTGLPPTPQEVDAYLADSSTDAFEKVVDRLLQSPGYGERWAALWLDLARYADTIGYERDPGREIWLYRDWLIRAFNRDLPFDQFTIEQLAGDLLSSPSSDQYVATAFHRNTMNNDEGGTDNEEYRVAAVVDRVNTTWDVWLGTSFSCVQCHGHPYDPFKHEEYYRFLAFFNNTRDEDTPHESPVYKFYAEEDQARIGTIRDWVRDHAVGASEEKGQALRRVTDLIHFAEPKIHPHSFTILQNGTHADTKYLDLYDDGLALLPAVELTEKRKLLVRFRSGLNGTRLEIRLDRRDGPLLASLPISKRHSGHFWFDLEPQEGVHDLYFLSDNPEIEKERSALSILWLMFLEELPGAGLPGFSKVEKSIAELLDRETETVPIMIENGAGYRRKTRVFERGNWLAPGQEVEPGVPASMPPLPSGAPTDRLGLARWMVSPENPLTARVAVNRFWEQIFGTGLVETLEDFGTRGSPPTHPRLLDWLAVEFMETHRWSIKSLLRQIVLSAAYRQSARTTPERLEKDPRNQLLSRGPRFRLSAEQIRDQVLAVSGLLSGKMYGPSVMPVQPEGVWQVIYSSEKWETSPGEDRYRRALYTYWRRTSPYPSMVAFDSPSREFCVTRRIRTNTPLQALVTLNDPVYFEAAQALGRRMRSDGGRTRGDWIRHGYRLALGRDPDAATLETLERLFEEASVETRPELLSAAASGGEARELWALAAVANTIMNLDEFLAK